MNKTRKWFIKLYGLDHSPSNRPCLVSERSGARKGLSGWIKVVVHVAMMDAKQTFPLPLLPLQTSFYIYFGLWKWVNQSEVCLFLWYIGEWRGLYSKRSLYLTYIGEWRGLYSKLSLYLTYIGEWRGLYSKLSLYLTYIGEWRGRAI